MLSFLLLTSTIVGCPCVAQVCRWQSQMLQEYPNKQVPFAELLGDIAPISLSCNYSLTVMLASCWLISLSSLICGYSIAIFCHAPNTMLLVYKIHTIHIVVVVVPGTIIRYLEQATRECGAPCGIVQLSDVLVE